MNSHLTYLRLLLDLLVIAVLAIISYRDFKTNEIPDIFNLSLLVLGVAAALLNPMPSLINRLIGLVAVSLPLLAVSLLMKNAIGGGDIKLMAAAGFLLGWQSVLLAAAIGITLAGAYAIWLLATKKAGPKEVFAFGPALCLGIACSYFFANPILVWLFNRS